ncbi:hypothetical protein JZ751_000967 [Albula glossodonta]|uniref:Uncharacterized protein n=1 Tax=Albula glossodonta TaxID=121402 RepID=A0A8T2PXT0_9TELE|nr:hypothetical protein JZ751_000967 [Albula glossodonta]
MQPIDYRRMFNPHHPLGVPYDSRLQCQAHARRETSCSETQTEPGEAVSKLMAQLGTLRPREEASEENELDSGVVSQMSGVSLHSEPRLSRNGRKDDSPAPLKADQGGCKLAAVASEWSTVAQHGSNSGHLEEVAGQDGWGVGPDGILPLDSSSRHEESDGGQVVDKHPQKLHPFSEQSDRPSSDHEERQSTRNSPVQQRGSPQVTDEASGGGPTFARSMPNPPLSKDLVEEDPEKSKCVTTSSSNMVGAADILEEPDKDVESLSYRILRLPCDELTTAGVLRVDDHTVWPTDTTKTLPLASGYLPPLGNGFLYSYYPSVAPERQSVLSPSLDELSSRDDMFSTDLEDVEVDSVSGRAHVGGVQGPPLVVSEGSDRGDEDEGGLWAGPLGEEAGPVCPARHCATCGAKLNGNAGRSEIAGSGPCKFSEEDSDEEVVEEYDKEDDDDDDDDVDGDNKDDCENEMLKDSCEIQEVLARKAPQPAGHLQPMGPQQFSQRKQKKPHNTELLGPANPEKLALKQGCPRGAECCDKHKTFPRHDRCKGQDLRSAQSRPRVDGQCGGGGVTTGQDSWESCNVKPRPKFWKPYPSWRGQERPSRRRGACKTFVPPRSRRRNYNDDDEGEFPPFQRGRGSTKRRGARY